MKKFVMATVAVVGMASPAFATGLNSVDCSGTSLALVFSDDVTASSGTVTEISVSTSEDGTFTALTSGSTLSNSSSSIVSVSLSSSDQTSVGGTTGGDNCFVKISSSAFTGVSAATVQD